MKLFFGRAIIPLTMPVLQPDEPWLPLLSSRLEHPCLGVQRIRVGFLEETIATPVGTHYDAQREFCASLEYSPLLEEHYSKTGLSWMVLPIVVFLNRTICWCQNQRNILDDQRRYER